MALLPPKKTKIICTIGPASQSQEVLERMISAGMNIARINFAHGDFDDHRRTIANVRAAATAMGQRVAIFGDLPGPKMRIGKLAEEPIQLERDQSFIIQTAEVVGNKERVSLNFEALPHVVRPGDQIFVNDGYIQLKVKKVVGQEVHCQIQVGGELRSHKGVNLPGIDLGISAFTERDRECLAFAAAAGLDGVSQSFVESAKDIEAVRQAARALNYDPFIIAKIERSRALDHLAEILDQADGLMVARGDLGVEIPIERVAVTQKQVIHAANLRSKPVITATHMLESMTDHRRPTRAEATDVANAILDGTDCVMLSGETAVGSYPDDAVATMAQIAQITELSMDNFGIANVLRTKMESGEISRKDLISLDIYFAARTLKPALLFIPSASGATACRITRFRLAPWIVAISLDETVANKLQFSYGVYPDSVPANPPSWPRYIQNWFQQCGLQGDLLLLVQGAGTLKAGDTTRLDIIDLS